MNLKIDADFKKPNLHSGWSYRYLCVTDKLGRWSNTNSKLDFSIREFQHKKVYVFLLLEYSK